MSMNKYISGIINCLDTVPSLKKQLVRAFKKVEEDVSSLHDPVTIAENLTSSSSFLTIENLDYTKYRYFVVDGYISTDASGNRFTLMIASNPVRYDKRCCLGICFANEQNVAFNVAYVNNTMSIGFVNVTGSAIDDKAHIVKLTGYV